MKRLILALAFVSCIGCGASNPLMPSIYTCTTQPRGYSWPDGTSHLETDTYTQSEPCPAVPID